MNSPSLLLEPYRPSAAEPWDARRVVHLHRRAGFAPTWSELQRDLDDTPQAAVDRFLEGTVYADRVPAEFESMSRVIAAAAVGSGNPARLKAWWLYRMLFSPDPLTERLTLLWHNHFATSNIKVADIQLMHRQNELFRRFARHPFQELLTRCVKDAAMLIWLDADSNRKQHPNENLARELMELFSMGVGNYSEHDVKETARALTGWSSKRGEFRFVAAHHDEGEKTIFGHTANHDGDQVLECVLAHPATVRRLAWRLCDHFFGEGCVDDHLLAQVAAGLRDHDLDIAWAVETLLRSKAFFDERNIGNRLLAPAELVVGASRALEQRQPPPSTLVLSEWTSRLGQDLFYPPNVFGWPGGRAWITTRSMIGRAAFGAALVNGTLHHPSHPLDVAGLAGRWEASSTEDFARCATTLLAPNAAESARGHWIKQAQKQVSSVTWEGEFLEALLASPDAQLG